MMNENDVPPEDVLREAVVTRLMLEKTWEERLDMSAADSQFMATCEEFLDSVEREMLDRLQAKGFREGEIEDLYYQAHVIVYGPDGRAGDWVDAA